MAFPTDSAPAFAASRRADAKDEAAEARTEKLGVRPAEQAVVQSAAPSAAQNAAIEPGVSEPDHATMSKDEGSTSAADISEPQKAAEPPLSLPSRPWAIVQALQNAPHYNGKLVHVASLQANGRIAKMRPGTGHPLAVRPANLRGLLEVYDGRALGEAMEFDDGEIELIGFDPKEAYWACKKANMYLWIPASYFG